MLKYLTEPRITTYEHTVKIFIYKLSINGHVCPHHIEVLLKIFYAQFCTCKLNATIWQHIRRFEYNHWMDVDSSVNTTDLINYMYIIMLELMKGLLQLRFSHEVWAANSHVQKVIRQHFKYLKNIKTLSHYLLIHRECEQYQR